MLSFIYKEGMSLVSVHNGDVHDFLIDMIGRSENPGPVWVGLTKTKTGELIPSPTQLKSV